MDRKFLVLADFSFYLVFIWIKITVVIFILLLEIVLMMKIPHIEKKTPKLIDLVTESILKETEL